MKKCHFCAEDIQEEAIKCRYCGEFLEGNRPTVNQAQPWYFKTSALVIGFLVVGPLIIPLIWVNPKYSNSKKIILTVCAVAVTLVLLQAVKISMGTIDQYYQMLQ